MAKSSGRRRARKERVHWIQVAEDYVRARRHADAIDALRKAIEIDPDDPTVLYNLGALYLATQRLAEAVTSLRRSTALDPTLARAHLLLANALQQTGEDDEGAIASYRRALALSPGLGAEVHGLLGDLLWDNGKRSEAVVAYETAAAASPGTTFGRLCLAKALTANHRPEEALQRLGELVVDDPSSSDGHMALGHLLGEVGRFDEASASFERAIRVSPELAGAHYGLVSSRRLSEADRPWLDRILSRLDRPGNGVRQEMTLHFAAGKAFDDLKDYARAMGHFDAANRLRRRLGGPFDRERLADTIQVLSARFTSEGFRSHPSRDIDETPILIVGMPRSGTTLVERILSAHPDVAGGGELVYWYDRGHAWLRTPPDRLAELEAKLGVGYLRLLRTVSPDALRVTDKNTFNWLWVGLVHALLPNARIVHCRRSPLDTCLGIYTTPLSYNWSFASDRGDLAAYYRLYLRMVAHWRAVLPSDRWLDVDYEEVTRAPEALARQLVAFAGLPWDPACSSPERNRDPVKTATKWQARQPIFRTSVGRFRHYAPWLGELRELGDAG